MANEKPDLTPQDREWLSELGITEAQIITQIEKFKRGPVAMKLIRPARIGDGILRLEEHQNDNSIACYEKAPASVKFLKFVPASGAATRMFKTLIHFNRHQQTITRAEIKEKAALGSKDDQFLLDFMAGLENGSFAFCEDLNQALLSQENGVSLQSLLHQGDYKEILDTLLTEKGLNYGNLPKALIKFHNYPDHSRTAIEEHLAEGRGYAKNKSGDIYLHLTVPPLFKETIAELLNNVKTHYQGKGEVFHIDYSLQNPATDTVAVDEDNQLCRDSNKKLILRPGGHGAVIENLNTLDGDIIFIKNIDNVVPDHLKAETIRYKKILAGYLLNIQSNVSSFLKRLTTGQVTRSEITEIATFATQKLNIPFPDNNPSLMTLQEKTEFLINKLNRPIRVCGMVRNEGDPGGGPFWVLGEDNTASLQIIENAQIDKTSKTHRDILANSTHFNPVDLVCGIKNFRGEKFDLSLFTDPNTYFISEKSTAGHTLKALELPGLWNGAMANWITIFIEVPIITFNPIKTVNDLLRDTHH